MSSGLRSAFSRPRKTNGATPNAAGVFTTPTEKFANFSSPAVSQRILHAGFLRTPEVNNSRYTQVRTARQFTRPTSPASSSRQSTLSVGGRHGILARKQNPVEIDKGSPVPCDTLQARLSVASQEAAELRKKPDDMKAVDRTSYAFKKTFSALPGEDWIAHVDALETHRANKFVWTARQFYYGLLQTLHGKALKTAHAMEEDIEELNLLDLLPD